MLDIIPASEGQGIFADRLVIAGLAQIVGDQRRYRAGIQKRLTAHRRRFANRAPD